jgi:hypothetical protein
MFTRVITLVSLAALSACGDGQTEAAERKRPAQLSPRERDQQLEFEQRHAATFAVGNAIRIRDTDPRVYLRGQTGKIFGIERKSTLQHSISQHEAGREIPAPVSRFRIVLDDRGVQCWAAPKDIEHRTK